MTLDGMKADLPKDIKSNGNWTVEKDLKTNGYWAVEKSDNVLDLQKDEKLKLQLQIRKMASDLRKEVLDTKKTAAISKLDAHFKDLLGKWTIQRSELNSIKEDIVNQYTTAKISNPSGTDTAEDNTKEVKVVEENTDVVIEKTNKHGIKETKVDVKWAIETIEKEIDASMLTIDQKAEERYLVWKPSVQMTKPQQDIAFTNFASDVAKEVDVQLLTVEEQLRMGYRFELLNLKDAVINAPQNTIPTNPLDTNPNSWNNNQDKTTNYKAGETIELYNYSTLFKDAYNNTSYRNADIQGKPKVYDIYKDNQMRSAMKDILTDPDDVKSFNKGTFGVNLSKENGFARVVDLLWTGKVGGYEFMVDKNTNKIKLMTANGQYREDGKITGDDLRNMSKAGHINYEHEKGFLQLDDEFAKMAKILNTAKWNNLETFSAVSGARSDQSTVLKEFANAKNNINKFSEETVFDFLCDRNGDHVLSGSNKERVKGERNQRDVGNIFGQQIKFTIDQAIWVQEALNPGKWENIVIQKIMSNIDIQDARKASPELAQEFNQYSTNLNYCTREHLVASIQKYPEFKVFFGAALEKINGGDQVLTPDLYDTLTGNSTKRFLESKDWEMTTRLEKRVDDALKSNKNLEEYLKTHDVIKLRQNLITQIMNLADGFTIVGSDTKEGYLRNPGISKEFVNKEAKTAFINDLTNKTLNSIAVGIFNPKDAIRIPVDFIKQGHSENGRTLWKVTAGPSIGYNRENQDILFTLGIGGEVAEQYNYNKVINAPLDEVKDAKYIGAEGRAIAGASLKNLTVGAEASIGLMREKDPVMGINQINRQYEAVSREIFRLSDKDTGSYENMYAAMVRNINSPEGKYSKFIETNKQRLLANADFVVSFLKANDALKQIPSDKKAALNELISMIQEGNMEQWRSDLLNNLHNNVDITKLSFGVTTNALTLGYIGNKSDGSYTKPGSSSTGADKSTDIESFANAGQTCRFGIAGLYVGARISNWKTEYHVNANQLVNTRHDIAEGKNTDRVNFKTPEKYAQYLEALFNKTNIDKHWKEVTTLHVEIKDKNKIIIRNSETNGAKLPELLNIRVTKNAASQVSYDRTTDQLIIGNVKDIWAYTTARPDGVVRQLCIGSKNYNDGDPKYLFMDEEGNTIKDESKIQLGTKLTGNYEQTSYSDVEKIANETITNETERALLKSCFDTNGQLKAETPGVTIENRGIIGAGTSLVFRKDKAGKYFLSVETGKSGVLSLRFADGEKFDKGQETSFKTETYTVKSPEIKKTLDALKYEDYANLEKNTNWGLSRNYITFMDYCDKDLNKASAALWYMIPATGKLGEIKKTLETARLNKDEKTQRYLVDQFKGLFAYEKSYEKQTIGQMFANRGDAFVWLLEEAPKSLKGNLKAMRDTLVKSNSDKRYSDLKGKKETIPELFGYTAFYRKQLNTDQRKFSLVSTADTTVMPIGGEPYTEITWDSSKEATDWITTRLNKPEAKEQRELLLDTILSNIKDEKTRNEFTKELTTEKLGELITTGKFTLDNSLKRIILSTKPAFYFKGECANESIGLVINTLEVQEAPVKENEVKKELVTDLNIDAGINSVAGKAKVRSNNVNWAYHKSVQFGDGSYTKAGSKDNWANQDSDVNWTDNNKF